ncbi:MAG: PaaI family thioesterase [Myxococcales bacterium]|nr:PaaI family thioesterase [Myxococcales bacterium]
MTSLVEELAAAKDAHDWAKFSEVIPYARFLGLELSEKDGELTTTMRYGEHLIGNPALPALHGGTLGALLESAAIYHLLCASDSLLLPKTITITIDYLRSAKARDTFARGVVTRRGRRVANVRVEAWQEDRTKPVAAALCHFLIVSPGEGDGASRPGPPLSAAPA